MRCNYCEWRCELKEGNTGVCGAYIMKNGAIKEKLPHHWSSLNVVHIESLPFYHAYPGSRSLSIGSSGCNFDCSYCSNSYIARVSPLIFLPGPNSPSRLGLELSVIVVL